MKLNLDHLGDCPFQERPHITNDDVEIDGPELRLHLAAEGKKLTRELAPSACGSLDLPKCPKPFVPFRGLLEQELGVPAHSLKEVIEIMSDPSGQGPDRLHLVSVNQLGFESLLLGDVAHEVERRGSSFPHAEHTANLQPDRFTGFGDPSKGIHGGNLLSLHAFSVNAGDGRPVFRMNEIQKRSLGELLQTVS